MEKVLLQIMDNGNEKAPINEYKWNRRLAIEYSFYKPDKFNVLNYDFTELLYHDSNKAINIAFKIFDAVKDQYFKIIKDSKELLKIENVEYFGELNFKIFCDMILFKDVIKIDLNEEYDDKHELILQDKEKVFRLKKHDNSALVFTLRAWTKTPDYWTVYFDLMEEIKREFDKNGIEIPFNQLDVHMVK